MSEDTEVIHPYMVGQSNTGATNLFGESEVDRENRKLLKEAEAKASAQAYMSRKDEDISPTERMLRDAAAKGEQASARKELDHISYEAHMAKVELAKAQQLQSGEPLNERQWDDIQKSDFKFYLSKVGTAIRLKHKSTLGLMYYTNN